MFSNLETEIKFFQWSSDFRRQEVHSFTFLERDNDVWSSFFRRHFAHDLMHLEFFWKAANYFVENRLDLRALIEH